MATLFEMRKADRTQPPNRQTCLGRAIFKAEAIANHVQKRRVMSGKPGGVYACEGCGFWHIGRP